jgi:phospholipid/cholesterol/gamma-HCH transport system substrate-binding protein
MKTNQVKQEVKAGMLVLAGVTLTMIAIVVLGGKQNIFVSTQDYTSHFAKVDGLVGGAKVVLGGLQIGLVNNVDFDEKSRDIKVSYAIESRYAKWIRQDSTIELVTQGVLGDKYLSINAGSMDQPQIPEGGEIVPGGSKDFSQLFNSSEKLMLQLQATAASLDQVLTSFNRNNRADQMFAGFAVTSKNLGELSTKLNKDLEQGKLKNTLLHLNSILEKIDHGQGSLGAFINDPGLYDDAKALVGQTNRNRIMRNLIRQTIKDNQSDSKQE